VQETGPAPGGELAQVQRVGLAGQAAVPGQEPGEREPLAAGEDGLDRGEGSGRVAVVIGHLQAGLRPGGLGRLRVPAIEWKPNVSRVNRSHHVTTRRKTGRRPQPETRPSCRFCMRAVDRGVAGVAVPIAQF
jgi:hypothetical protein